MLIWQTQTPPDGPVADPITQVEVTAPAQITVADSVVIKAERAVATVQAETHRFVELAQKYGPRIVGALLFVVAAWIISSWLSRLVLRGLGRAKVDVTLAKFLSNIVRWAIVVVAAVAGLGIFGVQTASFAAVIGSAGLAIGLAMQGSLSNIAAGVMLLLFRPFRVGDVVTVAGQTGKVDEIELFSTHIDTGDNRRIIIPNGQVFGSIIENQTHHETRAAVVNVTIDGSFDLEVTRAALLAAARGVKGRLEDPLPGVGLVRLNGAGVDWTVSVWSKQSDLMAVQQDLAQNVKSALDGAGMAGPIPAMMLKLPEGASFTPAPTVNPG